MPGQIGRARVLRKRSTRAERLLWSRLRNQKLCGYKFRRQHPIRRRIVDFFCVEAQLAIELDGSGHGFISKEEADIVRTQELAAAGIRVIRFWNRSVLDNTDGVIAAILFALDAAKSPWAIAAAPSPQSSPPGRGGRISAR
jgi:very-short-patch-repair endonuclease